MSACGVDTNLALLLPEGPQADMLFMHPACYVIDFMVFELWVQELREPQRTDDFHAGVSH